ncbi:MAG: hypothetical protein ABJG41_01440 [Cyclobacteriaceae bacterium]
MFELKLIDMKLPSELENAPSYDHLHSVMNRCIQETVKQREDQILKHLKENGFEFENRQELEQFSKTRCTLEKHDNQLNVLKVDGIQICTWWDTSRFETDGDKFTAIIGEAPIT